MIASPAGSAPSTPSKRPGSGQGTPRKAPRTPSASPYGDRFIPNRSNVDFELASWNLTHEAPAKAKCGSPAKDQYRNTIHAALFDGSKVVSTAQSPPSAAKILTFKEKPPAATDAYRNSLRVLHSQAKATSAASATRFIDQTPERTLDAPNLLDDYYLNLLAWSSRNQVAVALGQRVYLWDPVTSSIDQLMEVRSEDHYIASLSFTPDGAYIAVGTSEAEIQLYDATRLRHLRTMRGHSQRVSALAWNSHLLSSGGRDAKIVHHDVRMAEDRVAMLEHHQQEVCGLQWSPDGSQLASGGNDNLCCVWDAGNTTAPRHAFDAHQAAVKALAWSPHQTNLLASGGGTADRTIRFWNTNLGTCLNSVDSKSQVCALQWSKVRNEIISSHGFAQNQLIVWKYPTMSKVAELTGHTSRVLHLAQSPDGSTVVSAAADETLRFWRINQPERKGTPTRSGKKEAPLSCLSGGGDLIR